jgi:hypothetical protein
MIRVYAILAGIILALSVGLWYSLSGLFTARSELQATNALLVKAAAQNKSLEAFTEALQEQVKKAHLESSVARQGIENVLQDLDWAEGVIPEPVANELCKQLNCQPSETR